MLAGSRRLRRNAVHSSVPSLRLSKTRQAKTSGASVFIIPFLLFADDQPSVGPGQGP